jgi:VWFA-related protein
MTSRRTVVFLFLSLGAVALAASQTPTFRAGVDLVSVDVQVVDRDGRPVAGLAPERFEVSIGGRRRKVVSLDYIVSGAPPAAATMPADGRGSSAAAPVAAAPPTGPPRLFFLAIDALSFGAGESRGVAVAAQRFIEQLQPSDYVGVLTFPTGPRLNPTRDHATAIRALDGVVGQRSPPAGKFKLRPSEVLAIASRPNGCSHQNPLSLVRCDSDVEPTLSGACQTDEQCRRSLINQVQGDARDLEAVARTSLGTFGGVIRALANVQAQKIVVLVSAGLVAGTTPGVTPDIGTLPVAIGHEAARAQASVYTLFVDHSFIKQFAAENSQAPLTLTNLASDRAVLEQWLGDFTGTVGGAFLRVTTGNPELAFRRVLLETSARYLLGVEPQDADRDGQPRQLSVKVNDLPRGSAVRARSWVVLPKGQ